MTDKLIKSIERSVKILDCFNEHKERGITDIATMTGYSKSTVHDIVSTLTKLGVMHKDEETKKYQLGIKLFEYGYLFSQRNNLRSNVRDLGRELSDKYKATVHLATHDKNEIIYLDKFEHQGASAVSYTSVAKRVPITITGLGKAMLAFLPEEYKQSYIYSQPLPSATEYSITDIPVLEAELEEIKKNGYAIDNQESVLGLRCLACPIFDNNNQVIAAISVSLLAPYFPDERITEIAADISAAANTLSGLSF